MSDQVFRAVEWLYNSLPAKKEVETVVVREVQEMLPQSGRVFVKIAGLSGSVAVILGAYGAHRFRHKDVDPELKYTFETGNRYHFLHTLALLGVPLTRRPVLVGTLMTTGTVLFCTSCYAHALTENRPIRKMAPFGGIALILAWAAMIL